MSDDDVVDEMLDEILLDAPGDFFYPFSSLRLARISDELPITRNLSDELATAFENPTIDAAAKGRLGLGLCLLAINELERELAASRRELRGDQA
jgi:hypothetical protein